MRIVLIASPWIPVPPPGYGGTEVVVDELARGLAAAGYDVLLATTRDSTCPVERTWAHDRARTADMGDVAIELTHVLHAYDVAGDADVVNDHTIAGPVLGALRSTAPVVTTNHVPFNDDAHRLYRTLGDRVAIVAISHHQASTASDVPIARVIHHGVDAGRYPVGPGGDHLVFVGRMSPDKGVRAAIEIARRNKTNKEECPMTSINLTVCDGRVRCPMRGDTDVEWCYQCTHLDELTSRDDVMVVHCRASRSLGLYRARDDLPIDSYPPF